ncbi:MAG: hypothetical protein HYW23_02055 [Candidatus Aenigmarchaeota archaeon]|nr:hypothetical protein [Candidatus Aenigmarchaeota archaeon]
MARFSHSYLKRTIRDRILGECDIIVEGGVGSNLERYAYFREYGYNGDYVAVDKDHGVVSQTAVPSGVNLLVGDCFDLQLLTDAIRTTRYMSPLFLTNGSLADSLLIGQYKHVGKAVDIISRVFQTQLHIAPVSGVEIYHPRMHRNGNGSSGSLGKFRRFLDISAEYGWETEIVAKNLILMKKS